MARTGDRPTRELVLVGGGHSHVQVLRAFAMEPPPATRITVVVDIPVAVYSGMVPGFVAGQYQAHELEIDVVPLARRAGARVILVPAVGIDAVGRRILVEGRPPVPYDLASVDVGSTVAGLDLPGIRRFAVPTRPIGRFVQRVDGIVRRFRERPGAEPFRVVVVGAGAGGVELAFTLERRLTEEGAQDLRVHLVQAAGEVLPGYPAGLVERVHRAAGDRGIEIVRGRRVVKAEEGRVMLEGGEALPCDLLVWVSGAVSHGLFRTSGLPTDDRGFVLVRPTLQVQGHDDLLAAGDCATLTEDPETPKAGVYAVRQGPFLIDNLRSLLDGGKLRPYRPQKGFLTLLNLGDGTALGTKWGLSIEGRWVMRLKDWIDRRFMRRFQVLDSDGAPAEDFPAMDGEMEMLCGGCAAKVGRSALERALARLPAAPAVDGVVLGLEAPDDAAAVRGAGGEVRVSTVDAFRAFTDDPYLVGRVAAVNAVSDVYATGGEPCTALALVAVPEDASPDATEEVLYQVLAGIRASLDPLGVTLLGGHTTTAPELLVGLQVEGPAQDGQEGLLRLAGLTPGQLLVLTKPLGTGVLFHADMQGLARGPWVEAALASMLRPNREASRVAREAGVRAATDVTGFGLAGHLGAMLRAGGVAAEIELDALPALPGAVELLSRGLRSTFHPENARSRRAMVLSETARTHAALDLLFDPQTSGGLLFGVPEERAEEVVERLRQCGDPSAAVIGRVTEPRPDGALLSVV